MRRSVGACLQVRDFYGIELAGKAASNPGWDDAVCGVLGALSRLVGKKAQHVPEVRMCMGMGTCMCMCMPHVHVVLMIRGWRWQRGRRSRASSSKPVPADFLQ